MIDPKKVDMNQLPKKFIDGAIGAHGKEIFSFALPQTLHLGNLNWDTRLANSIFYSN